MTTEDLAARIEAAAADLFWMPPGVRVLQRPDLTAAVAPHSPEILHNTVYTAHPESPAHARRLASEIGRAHPPHLSRWTLNPRAQDLLAQPLLQHGYQPWRTCQLRVAATRDLLGADADADLPRVALVRDLPALHAWHATAAAAFGRSPGPHNPDLLQHDLRLALGERPRVARLLALDDHGRPIAAAALTRCPDHGVAFLWAGGTLPAHRNQGAYSALLLARARLANDLPWIALFAIPDTSAPIVERRGFKLCGEMAFWDR